MSRACSPSSSRTISATFWLLTSPARQRAPSLTARRFEVVERIQRDAQASYSAEERALQARLKETQAKLASLTGKDQANAPANLTSEQTKAIEEFRGDMVQTRRQLRDVQAALRSD